MKKNIITCILLIAGVVLADCGGIRNIPRSKNINKGNIAVIKLEEQPFRVVGSGGANGLMWALAEEAHRQKLEEFYKDQLPALDKANYEFELESGLIKGINDKGMFTAKSDSSYVNPSQEEYSKNFSRHTSNKYMKEMEEKRKNVNSDYILEYRLMTKNISLVQLEYYANFYVVYTLYDKNSKVVWQFIDFQYRKISGPYEGSKKSVPDNLLDVFSNLEKTSVSNALNNLYSGT